MKSSAYQNGGSRRKISPLGKLILGLGAVAFLLGGGSIVAQLVNSGGEQAADHAKQSLAGNDPQKIEPEKLPECAPEQLRILPIISSDSYGPGETPQFTLSVTNSSDKACYRNLGTSQLVFKVESAGVGVWDSRDCQRSPDDRKIILEPSKTLKTEPLEWNRTYSSPESCDGEREEVIADGAAYNLLVAVGDVPGESYEQFLLY